MTSSSFSPIKEINEALKAHNPFAQPPYVGNDEVWDKEFPDITSLNAHASDAVFEAIKQIRANQYQRTSITITAEAGSGKTHVISRIRHRLQAFGGALFIYANQFGDLNNIKQGFQRTLADSLNKIGNEGVTQWQELAAVIVNNALKSINSNTKHLSAKKLVKQFGISNLIITKRLVNNLTDTFCKNNSTAKNPDVIRAILWTLSDSHSLYAINWLSGNGLSQNKASELCLPIHSGSAFNTVKQILNLIGYYKELVICFDELDSAESNDNGFTKAQVVAGFVKELFENIRKGVILTVMMPAVWVEQIKKLPAAVAAKVSAQGNPIDLRYMDGDSIVELVTLWLKQFYQDRNLVPPYATYPFTEVDLRELSEEKPPIRNVLRWCRENCKPPETGEVKEEDSSPESKLLDPVEEAFKTELAQKLGKNLDDNFLLADALLFNFQRLIGYTVEQVTIEEITDKVTKKAGKDKYLNFKIIGTENRRKVCIGVAILQDSGGRALGAGFKRLIDEEKKFNLSRGCLVRSKSKDKEISNYLYNTYLKPLISKGGEFVELKESEIKPLLAIRSVHKKRNVDYGLTEEQIFQFIADKATDYQLGESNPLLQEILSDPSYEVPDDVIEDDSVLAEESTNSESADFEDVYKQLING
ncbi:KAP family P-loop domain protein [Rivularia sp. PCC 7116]|uniref:P-loop NTPase fold protein n=1 Tax=Rivularia sp. PCC 7116 TaxID=373994 RepID=UPI00029EC7A4|nr:P-loop NTPase fold protein [Rivularia sp. PCC 7116]AFY54057.1 KAP family P-loop domain protein [Rivularia sp. PCC 7116]